MTLVKAAAVQISPVLYSREGTVDKVCQQIIALGRQGVQFAVFPETVVPYYPYFSFVTPPVAMGAEHMRLSFNPRQLGHEWRVRSSRLNLWGRVKYFARMVLLNLAGVYLFARKMDTKTVRWSHYTDELVENSDFRKFDGMLRMVMDGSEAQYRDLREYLEGQHREGRLVYGMHRSREALLTCIVFSYNGNHVHFVDGSDGGYALAARSLKAQLKSLRA